MCNSRLLALLGALLLAACQPAPKATPALWQVDGPGGQRAWLLGTIHALPAPVDWRSPRIDAALAGADRLAVEVADLDAGADAFRRLATSPGHPPLSQRVDPALRPQLLALLAAYKLADGHFGTTETWAAALQLNQQGAARTGHDPANGIDRALLNRRGGKPVVEFEGAARQLGIFDRLPEAEQRDLLAEVVRGWPGGADEARRLAAAWAQGDMATIAGFDHTGLLADPQLREALLVGRNRAWLGQLRAMLARGERPFVAVGAAHLAGADGLPAQLAAQGFTVTRLQ